MIIVGLVVLLVITLIVGLLLRTRLVRLVVVGIVMRFRVYGVITRRAVARQIVDGLSRIEVQMIAWSRQPVLVGARGHSKVLLRRAILSISAIVEGIIVELVALLERLSWRRRPVRVWMLLRLCPIARIHFVVIVIVV